MNNTSYFHFTLGPVQGFVAQARRTRDFWAGSFILSWLAAVAIKATQAQGGEIKFPAPDSDYMAWLEGKQQGKKPTQGSIPNRFKASINPDKFNPSEVIEAVQEAWKALADKVWERDLGDFSPSSEAALIWDRQVPAFWDMNWVITGSEDDSSALDKRKNWRSYCPPNEPGVKCAMMDGWQELSGEKSPNRADMNRFWKPVRESKCSGIKSDLAENEALCAIAFIKRRFSRHFKYLDHTMKQGWRLKGWEVPSAVPSVTYMAAVHWLEQALNKANANALEVFHQEARRLTGDQYGEWDTEIKCLKEAWGNQEWKALDGNVFFSTLLENKNLYPDEELAKQVRRALAKINETATIEPVSPFYAILLMDGDSLGKHMSDTNKQSVITQGLNTFTKGVPAKVYQHNGFLIYAGGDDVLAILPLEDAIPCAVELRKHYMDCFKDSDIPTSLSGAIEFVHIKTALTKVLKDAHQLLDDVAKDGRGRDALAIRVWKPGGLQLEWAQPWEVALSSQNSKQLEGNCPTVLEEIAKAFQKIEEKQEQFASKFFYKIRERFDLLNPVKDKDGKYAPSILKPEQAVDLLVMEYLNSWGNTKDKDIHKAKELVAKLLKQCHPIKRDPDHQPAEWLPIHGKDINMWKADGALLVRFLARKGVEQ